MPSVNEHAGAPITTGAPVLELHEIQATVLRQRPAPYFGSHVLLRVDNARAGREFLRRLIPYVDSAGGWRNAENAWIAVGISYAKAHVATDARLWLTRSRFHDGGGPLCQVVDTSLRYYGKADGTVFLG
jgi:hypothetical protein